MVVTFPTKVLMGEEVKATGPSPLANLADSGDFVRPSVLCSKCETVRNYLQTHSQNEAPRSASHVFEGHGNGIELQTSAQAGCHLCAIILETLDRATAHHEDGTPAYKSPEGFAWVRLVWKWDNKTLTVQTNHHSDFAERHLPARRTAERHLYPSSFARSTDSETGYDTAKVWLADCLEHHASCREDHDKSFVPKRLLQVGYREDDSKSIRLVELRADIVCPPYVTLSYCWGGNSGLKLTSSTRAQFHNGVPLEKFPRTIRDAILVSRQLGFEYLWVDSLCIVQDDQADWAAEAAQMSGIYSNSLITIAAVSASHNEQGLFEEREPLSSVPCWLFKDGEGVDYYVDNMEVEMPQLFGEDAVLYNRGWVLQERFLSRRTLGYGRRAITWECREKILSDTFLIHETRIQTLNYTVMLENPKGRAVRMSRLPSVPGAKKALGQEVLEVWSLIVADYTRTSLTYVKDKLVAIKGLVTVFQNITGWKSIYGLWQPYLLHQLLWSPAKRHVDSNRPTGVAPSWSWAGSTGRAEYKNFTTVGVLGKERLFAADLNIPELLGPVSGSQQDFSKSKLLVSTYIFQVEAIGRYADPKFGIGNTSVDVVRGKFRYEKGTFGLDHMDLPDQLLFVPLCLDEDSMVTYLLGLCVKRSDAVDTAYQRCGMICFALWGSIPDLSLFSSGEERDRIALI